MLYLGMELLRSSERCYSWMEILCKELYYIIKYIDL
jgi:hypothetical protein